MDYDKVIDLCDKMNTLRRNAMRNILSKYDLYPGQPEILIYVYKNPGCTQNQAAHVAGVTAASIAASFKRMENAGLIRRRNDMADMRCNRVYITDSGKQRLLDCKEEISRLNTRIFHTVSYDNINMFCSCLEQLNRNLDDINKKEFKENVK